MKKISNLLTLGFLAFGLSACTLRPAASSEPASEVQSVEEHVHAYEDAWTYDDTHHWHTCEGCVEKKDYAEHVWDEGEVVKEPSLTEEGILLKRCACGQTKTEKIDKLTKFEAAEVMRGLSMKEMNYVEAEYVEECLEFIEWFDNEHRFQLSETFYAEANVEYGFRFEKTELNIEADYDLRGYTIGLYVHFEQSELELYSLEFDWIKDIKVYSADDLTTPVFDSGDFKYTFDDNDVDDTEEEYSECRLLTDDLPNGTYYLFVTFNMDCPNAKVAAAYVLGE